MASPPFNINQALPGDTDVVSQHPANARTMRDVVESWLAITSDTWGRIKVQMGNTATRDALTDTMDGTLFVLNDVTPKLLQRWNGAAWENLGPITATEGASGILKIGTQAEVNAGAVTDKIVTPDKLAAYAPPWATVAVDLANDKVVITDASDAAKLKQVTAASLAPAQYSKFISGEQTIAVGDGASVAHSLGAVPDIVWPKMKCVAAGGDGGYAQNEFFYGMPTDSGGIAPGIALSADGTNVKYKIVNGVIIPKLDGTGFLNPASSANWRLVMVAYRFLI